MRVKSGGADAFPRGVADACSANPGWEWEDRANPITAATIAIRRANLIEAINGLMSLIERMVRIRGPRKRSHRKISATSR